MEKRAIIIGATSGIGKQLAINLLQDAWVVGVAGRREAELLALRENFGAEKVKIAVMDVTQPSAGDKIDELIASMGHPDLLLYASGIGKQNPSLDENIEIDTVKTNCEGMVRIVDKFLQYVRDNASYYAVHTAQVAVISSVAGTKGLGAAPAYSATKKMQSTYLVALSQFCRMQKIPADFTDIRPGFVATAILNPNKHYPMLMTVEKAADIIVRGLRRRRRVLIFDWRFRLLVAFWNLIPTCLWERLTMFKN